MSCSSTVSSWRSTSSSPACSVARTGPSSPSVLPAKRGRSSASPIFSPTTSNRWICRSTACASSRRLRVLAEKGSPHDCYRVQPRGDRRGGRPRPRDPAAWRRSGDGRAHLAVGVPAAGDPRRGRRGPAPRCRDRRRPAGRDRRDAVPARPPRPRAPPDAPLVGGGSPAAPPPGPRGLMVPRKNSSTLRPRGEGAAQPITTVELFFDLVYVFAVTQLSHLILNDLSVAGAAHAALLLVTVWWAWIYTTWMANWFDPASAVVRAVLTGVMLGSLLMAAALPGAFGGDGVLFAVSYVALQVGRNLVAASMLARDHPLRDVFERLVGWSAASGVLWLAGSVLD